MKWNRTQISGVSWTLGVLLITWLVLCASFLHAEKLPSSYGSYGLVSEDEAVAIAELWIAMELNSGYLKIDEAERLQRLSNLQNRTVLYLVSKDELRDTPPEKGNVLAYIIKYEPSGFVIIAGSDRIQPIIAFDARSTFKWAGPEYYDLRNFIGNMIARRWRKLGRDVHPIWRYLRSKLQKGKALDKVTFERPKGTIYVLWHTAHWSQGGFYNDVVIANNGNTPGIPTGCTATAMAIKFRFHEWPITGNDKHSYCDNSGNIQYCHSVNFGAQTYNWSNMPTTNLTTPNLDVATLMYHCGVAVNMNYEVGASGAWPGHKVDDELAIHKFFRYKGTEYIRLLGQKLFEIDSTFKAELDSAIVSEELRHVFEDNGYTLSQNVTVTVKANNEWVIHDIGNGQEYVVVFNPGESMMPVYSLDESKQDEPSKASIRGGLPVICGSRSHAMVIDGYRDTQWPFFHVNHGHGGPGNAWYELFFGSDVEHSWPYCSPENYIYVNANWTGTENGNIQTPFNTFAEGESAVPTRGHLWLKAGTYSVAPITINKAMTIRSYEGTATLSK